MPVLQHMLPRRPESGPRTSGASTAQYEALDSLDDFNECLHRLLEAAIVGLVGPPWTLLQTVPWSANGIVDYRCCPSFADDI